MMLPEQKWCDICGNPGPFEDKTCLVCLHQVTNFVTDLEKAYKIWLDFRRERLAKEDL